VEGKTMKSLRDIVRKDIYSFLEDRGVNPRNEQLYIESEYGFKLAIPTGIVEGDRIKYDIFVYLELDRVVLVDEEQKPIIERNKLLSKLRKMADEKIGRLIVENHPTFIGCHFYAFNIKKIVGKFLRSTQIGYNKYCFFSRLARNQVKFRVFKLLGAWLKKRGEGIIRRKRELFGYLEKLVEMFLSIGEKLYDIGVRNIILKRKPIKEVKVKEEKQEDVEKLKEHVNLLFESVKAVYGEEAYRDMMSVLNIYRRNVCSVYI